MKNPIKDHIDKRLQEFYKNNQLPIIILGRNMMQELCNEVNNSYTRLIRYKDVPVILNHIFPDKIDIVLAQENNQCQNFQPIK